MSFLFPSPTITFEAALRDLAAGSPKARAAAAHALGDVTEAVEKRRAVDAIGWVLWQRMDDCEVPTSSGSTELPKGFGVLFEAIPMETRSAIANLVSSMKRGG